MNIPFELLSLFTVFTFGLSIIGYWKKIPFMSVIAGLLMTFIFIIITDIDGTPVDMWFRIVFMLFGVVLMIGGALTWKSMPD